VKTHRPNSTKLKEESARKTLDTYYISDVKDFKENWIEAKFLQRRVEKPKKKRTQNGKRCKSYE